MHYVTFAFGLALAAASLTAQTPEVEARKAALQRAREQKNPIPIDQLVAPQRRVVGPAPMLFGDTAGPAKRIWAKNKDVENVWLRRNVELPKPCKSARLAFSCDNECTVFVNGLEVGACPDHQHLTVVDVPPPDKAKLTIAVQAKNTGGPGALVLWFLWEDADGKHEVTTDANWRLSEAEVDGWSKPAFDDSRWEMATAEFESDFGKNAYNGEPTRVHVVNALTPTLEPIDQAVAALRVAKDRDAALKALEELDRAVVRAREHVWKMPAAADKAPK